MSWSVGAIMELLTLRVLVLMVEVVMFPVLIEGAAIPPVKVRPEFGVMVKPLRSIRLVT